MKKISLFLPILLTVTAAILLLISVSGGSSGSGDASAITQIRRLDEDGYLYYMDYDKDYYSSEVLDEMRKKGLIDPGCSCFAAYNTEGELISCRNYDYPHRMSEEDRSLTGLNIVLHCRPEGKYESIAVADAVWCDEDDPLLRPGGPD